MMIRLTRLAVIFCCVFFSSLSYSRSASTVEDEILILCYHDIPQHVVNDPYGVDQYKFVRQIEYLRTHGYTFVSLDFIRKAMVGDAQLPQKPVLLTFDDGYRSYAEFVVPLLREYGYPSVLAIPTLWFEQGPPQSVTQELMTWSQIREVAQSPLVELASHTHALHTDVQFNPQGNRAWSAVSRIYDPDTQEYESEAAYRERVWQDLVFSKELLEAKIDKPVKALVWPYGKYNQIALNLAKKAGYRAMLTLHDRRTMAADNLEALPRYMLYKNPGIAEFAKSIQKSSPDKINHRVIQADLDMIYDPDPNQQERNLDAFIERIYSINPSMVFLQAYADPQGTGNIESVYFPNRVLPMRADLFSRVANQLIIREIKVYAWMPMLSIRLPDQTQNRRLRVRELREGEIRISTSWYERLSPFSKDTAEQLSMLYADLAAHCRLDGIIFQDDGYLNDYEDFHAEALDEYHAISNNRTIPVQQLTGKERKLWTKVKTRQLITLTDTLKKVVLRYRPYAEFARTFYAPVLMNPTSEEWFAQNYELALSHYDYVAVMAYPYMEKVKDPEEWLQALVSRANLSEHGLQKTFFKVQAIHWNNNDQPIAGSVIHRWLRVLVQAGAKNVGYYPDNYVDNHPKSNLVRLMLSTNDFPLE